jgi:hypothetical protein
MGRLVRRVGFVLDDCESLRGFGTCMGMDRSRDVGYM